MALQVRPEALAEQVRQVVAPAPQDQPEPRELPEFPALPAQPVRPDPSVPTVHQAQQAQPDLPELMAPQVQQGLLVV
jgi:hypothetical protein